MEDGLIRRRKPQPNSPVRYGPGSARSIAKLKKLNFDPITELVELYGEIQGEIEYQKKLRSQEVVELTATGKPRAYFAPNHYGLFDKAIKIGESLLRYKYGRVPENQIEAEKVKQSLTINLSKKGDTYVLNDQEETLLIE
jgi:hypothetical protein